MPVDAERHGNDVAVESTAPGSDVVEPVVVESQWVRYLSPEGYPYLYDEVTGESVWVVSGEDEAQSPQTEEPSGDTTDGREHWTQGDARQTLGERDGHKDLLGTARMEEGERSTTVHPAEGESVGTCEVSQWSQDTSGPDARNSAGETAMHLAAAQRSPRGISLLLANGASVNATDHRGRTPLHAACENSNCSSRGGADDNDVAVIELLLSSGALEDARDARGQTALHLSALAGNLRAAQALLSAGATAVADDAGNSPLHLAAARGHSDMIQLLVSPSVGKRDDPPRKENPNTPASIFSEVETEARSRASAREFRSRSAFDVSISAHERVRGTASIGRRETATTSTTLGEQVFGDDDVAPGTTTAPRGQPFGATDDLSHVPGEPREHHTSRGEAPSRYAEPQGSSLDDGPTAKASVANDRSWDGPSSLNKAVPIDRNYPSGRWDVHDTATPLWRGQADSYNGSIESSIQNADSPHPRVSEDGAGGSRGHGHRGVEAEHRRRRARGSGSGSGGSSKLPRRRHEGPRDGMTRALGWAEPLPSNEYVQVLAAAFAGEGNGNDGTRAPSRATLSAALFAACLASQPGDAAAVLHLLKTHCFDDGMGDALVEAGARLTQRNMQGFTPREGLLNTKPMFTRGRLPKVLRATLAYIERVETSAAQPNSPTWTAHDGYGSDAPAVSAASRQGFADNHHHHHRPDPFEQPSSRWGVQPLTTTGRGTAFSALVGNGQRRLATGGAPTPITSITDIEPRRHNQGWEPRELAGGRDDLDGLRQSKGGFPLGGGGRGERSECRQGLSKEYTPRGGQTEERAETNGMTESESEPDSEEEPPANSGVPSRLRTGVWSVVGRAIDSLIGGGGRGSSDDAHSRPRSEAEGDDSDQETIDNPSRRPPTDAELRARMRATGSQSSELGSKHASGARRVDGAARSSRLEPGSAPDTEQPSTSAMGQAAAVQVKVPISLTPMQPPPDVVAAIKGRAALGSRRPRFSTPPDDVAAALERTREEANKRGLTDEVDLGAADGEGANSATRYTSNPENRTRNQQRGSAVRQELGPFSLSASGGLGKQGGRSARSMYINYFDERERMHGTGADGV
eukprot:g10564.t1